MKSAQKIPYVVAIIYDYSVLAGTHKVTFTIRNLISTIDMVKIWFARGNFHRRRRRQNLCRCQHTDSRTECGNFFKVGSLTGSSLRIAVSNGYCFAGNAALFGTADFRIATENSWIGMAGPAMIKVGLGKYEPTDIGPSFDA